MSADPRTIGTRTAFDRAAARDRILLSLALLALAAVFALWFHDDRSAVAALLFFALPPLLLALGVWTQRGSARFWSGVIALGWFSHGVMIAWADAAQRGYALAEIALALLIVFVSSASGLRAKFGKR
ncbi:MAG: DUF2069 domain-containing protein [Pseudomonadota bacterium]